MSEIVTLVRSTDAGSIEMINDQVLTVNEITMLNAMNKRHVQVVCGGKHKILIYKPCSINGERLCFEDVSQFHNYFTHKDKIAGMNAGNAWKAWGGKDFYPDGVSYHPDPSALPDTVYNTYRPLQCKPANGDASPIVWHIKEILCGGDIKAFNYFIGWLAHLFQRPGNKPTVAILMKSVEGTGKGTLYKLLSKMLGRNAHQLNGDGQITGRFNSVVAGKLLIFADEIDLTNKKVFDSIKGIISEPTVSLELKGLEPEAVPNFARFLFAGNHDRVLRAGVRERRFLVLEPVSTKVGDTAYWTQLNSFINNGGDSIFLNYLLELDISDFNPYQAPPTKALIQEKLASLSMPLSYVYEELINGEPFGGAKRLSSTDLVSRYQTWLSSQDMKQSSRAARAQISHITKAIGAEKEGRSGRGVGIIYELPKLKRMLQSFAKIMGHDEEDLF